MIKFVQQKKVNFKKVEDLLNQSISSNQMTNRGPCKFLLEKKLEKLFNLDSDKRVICVGNGTLALHALMLFYNKISKKELKWVTPSFTFPSSVVGNFESDILDIDETYSMPLTDENLSKYDGFIITNLFGTYPNNFMEWVKRCKDENKILIFDNASSPLTTINGKNICAFGDAAFGSLHHTKYLGFGEGGFIVIDSKYYDEINNILCFGFNPTEVKRRYNKFSSNFKMSDVSAAFILQHIESYDIANHIKIQDSFLKFIEKQENLKIFNYSESVVYGNLPILFNKPVSHLSFRDLGIEANKYYYPLKEDPNSLKLYEHIINLPLHAELSEYEIDVLQASVKIAAGGSK